MYLNYSTYIKYGGKVQEESFDYYNIKAQAYLDNLTNNRITKLFDKIPDEILVFLVSCIESFYKIDTINGIESKALSSYSNGIESFSYDNSFNTLDYSKNTMKDNATILLSKFPCLLCKKVKCNARCNNSSK